MKIISALFCLFISVALTAFAQTDPIEIQKLQAIAKANEARAIKAENEARIANDQVKHMRYLAVALEIADQSMETQDKELATLLAVLAYNFNKHHGGTTFNNRIYSALSNATKMYSQTSISTEAGKSPGDDVRNTSSILPNGRFKVEAEKSGNLKLVNEEGMTVRVLSGHRAQVDQIKFTRTGTLMITAGKDNTIRIWNLNRINLRPLVITEGTAINDLSISADDKRITYTLATSPKTMKVQLLDVEEMAGELCKRLTRNLTADEWQTYVGDDLTYELVCNTYPPGK